jgi:hypothetical protein
MKSKSLVRGTSDDLLSPYVVGVIIEDEIATEVTARAMGWVPLEGEDGITIWVRSEDIGVDDAPYCDTAFEWLAPTHIENKVSHQSGESSATIFRARFGQYGYYRA